MYAPSCHVTEALLCNSPVSYSLGQVLAEAPTERHHHVQTSVGTVQLVDSVPVEQDESLKLELLFQNSIEHLAVVAAVRSIDALIRAHDRGYTSVDTVDERPEVKLVEGLVVNVRRNGLDAEIGSAIGFLLIANEMLTVGVSERAMMSVLWFSYLEVGNDASILVSNDGLGVELAR